MSYEAKFEFRQKELEAIIEEEMRNPENFTPNKESDTE